MSRAGLDATAAGPIQSAPASASHRRRLVIDVVLLGAAACAAAVVGASDVWFDNTEWLLAAICVGAGWLCLAILRRIRIGHDLDRDAGGEGAARTDVMADLGHELRTPLHGVIGMLAMLRETRLDSTQSGYVEAATNSANHLLSVLNNVVDLSRIEEGKMSVQSDAVDVARLVRDLGGLAMGMAKRKGLGFRTRVDETMPRWSRLDGTRVRQVLLNLLSNAVNYSERGDILFVATTGVSNEGRQQLRFMVKDHGIGMDAATVATLFQRFSRGRREAEGATEGAGLGLQISMALARLMGGTIRVASEPGAGSTFELILPCLPCSEPEVASARNGELAAAAGTLRVMVVEDHPINRQYLAAVLARLGHEVVLCNNGDQALKAAVLGDIDVALMDIRMPGMDGFEVTRRLRKASSLLASLHVVALTADVSADARRQAVEAGMEEFLAKPVRPGELAAVLERLGGRNRKQSGKNGGRNGACVGSESLTDPEVIGDLCESVGLQSYQTLVFNLCDEKGATLGALRDALDHGDAGTIAERAHGLKGAALTLGLKGLAAKAAAMEQVAAEAPRRNEEWTLLIGLLPALRDEAIDVASKADRSAP